MTGVSENRYLALPVGGRGPGILVLHPWWGLNQFMRSFCDRLALEGFVALAPDLYYGKIAKTIEEAEQLSSQLFSSTSADGDILAGLKELRGLPALAASGLGLIGFSMGASWGLWLADERPDDFRAVTLFYGTGGEITRSKAAFLGHFAENDPYETPEGVQALENNLRVAGRPVDFYTYPGTGHWFFETDRADAYDRNAAELAWDRTIDFLRKHLNQA